MNDADAADEPQRAKRAHAYFCALCKTRQARLNGDGDGDARRLACLLARPECNYLTLFSDSARRARAHPPSSIETETTRIVPVPGRAIAAAVCRIFQIAQFIAASEREHDNTQTQSTHTANTHTHTVKRKPGTNVARIVTIYQVHDGEFTVGRKSHQLGIASSHKFSTVNGSWF